MNAMYKLAGSVALVLALADCHGTPMAPHNAGGGQSGVETMSRAASAQSSQSMQSGNVKGSGGQMPAFYDGRLIEINTLEISDTAGDRVASNPSHNEIFVTNDLDDPQDFHPVIDAIQGDGFNPLWEQIKIVFNPGITPHQFTSDDEVEQAAAGAHPEITLVDTGEMYRCSVVGTK